MIYPQIKRELSKEKNRHALSPPDAPAVGIPVVLPLADCHEVFVWNTEPETFAEPESGGKRKAPANQARGGVQKNIAMM